MNESEETEEIKTFPLYLFLLQGQQALPNCKSISVGRPSDVRYMTPLTCRVKDSADDGLKIFLFFLENKI